MIHPTPIESPSAALEAKYAPGAMTLAEFCRRYSLDRSTLFKLRRDGLGPDEIMVGRKILIPNAAAAAWEARMMARTRMTKIAAARPAPAPAAEPEPQPRRRGRPRKDPVLGIAD